MYPDGCSQWHVDAANGANEPDEEREYEEYLIEEWQREKAAHQMRKPMGSEVKLYFEGEEEVA